MIRDLVGVGLIGTLVLAAGGVMPTAAPRSTGAEDVFDDPQSGRFIYLRSGAPITLEASPLYAAALVSDTMRQRGPLTPPDGLELDPRGDRPDLADRGLTLFRVPHSVTPRGLDTPPTPDAWQVTFRSGLAAQPVFEHGAALRIPYDEVIVGFDPATSLEDARRLLSGVWDDLDATGIMELREGVFICHLSYARAGRTFEVSRMLTDVEGVVWAEPSFINIYLETPGGPPVGLSTLGLPTSLTHEQELESRYVSRMPRTSDREPDGDVWRVMIDGHFENDIEKWYVARDVGSNRILPFVVREPTHEGQRAVHMSGKGLAANDPPDPYREGAGSYLISPIFDLSAYNQVFVELWFWARFEDPVDAPRQIHDFARVLIFDVETNEYLYEHPIVPVGPNGDLTRGPGTDRGWRKLMFRVPFWMLANPLQVRIHFFSDGLGGAEGLFIDDVRVLYGSDEGGEVASRDPASRRQYAIMPRGQIAGWPASSDPRADAAAAWSLGEPEHDVIVALLDDGVERNHPDLAFWEPEKGDETEAEADQVEEELFPGEPLSPEDRHGTACAGVLGAVANDGIGIAGVAPGAQLLPLHRGMDDVSIVLAIDAAVAYGAHVLVIPWGWSGAAPEVITQAIIDAIEAGVTVVAAAGDGVHRPYSDSVDYPCVLGDSTPLICVGASSIAGEPKGPASADGHYWWTSATDDAGPDLLAPGTWLHATDRQGPLGYNEGTPDVPPEWTDEFSGTGASACFVGGVATLVASHDPLLEPAELKRLITATATEIPASHPRQGELLLVNPGEAVKAAAESAAARKREDVPGP